MTYIKGHKHSIETRRKMSESHKKLKLSESHKKNISNSLIGNKRALGHIPWNKGKEWKDMKGDKNPAKRLEVREKISQRKKQDYLSGRTIHLFKKEKDNINFIDGRSKFVCPGRFGSDWKKIRTRILIRDDYKCQKCGVYKSDVRFMDIHHKESFLISFDNSENNLITL